MSSPEPICTHRTSNYNFNSNANATLNHIDTSGTNTSGTNTTTSTNTNTNTTTPTSLVHHITNNNCQTVNINGLTDSGVNLARGDGLHRGHSRPEAAPNATETQRQNHQDEVQVAEPASVTVGMIIYPAFWTALVIGASWIFRTFLGVSGITDRTTAVEDIANAEITGEVLDEDEV